MLSNDTLFVRTHKNMSRFHLTESLHVLNTPYPHIWTRKSVIPCRYVLQIKQTAKRARVNISQDTTNALKILHSVLIFDSLFNLTELEQLNVEVKYTRSALREQVNMLQILSRES